MWKTASSQQDAFTRWRRRLDGWYRGGSPFPTDPLNKVFYVKENISCVGWVLWTTGTVNNRCAHCGTNNILPKDPEHSQQFKQVQPICSSCKALGRLPPANMQKRKHEPSPHTETLQLKRQQKNMYEADAKKSSGPKRYWMRHRFGLRERHETAEEIREWCFFGKVRLIFTPPIGA